MRSKIAKKVLGSAATLQDFDSSYKPKHRWKLQTAAFYRLPRLTTLRRFLPF